MSTYKRVGRHDLPEPTRTTAPAGSLLTREDVDTVKLGTSIGNVGFEGVVLSGLA